MVSAIMARRGISLNSLWNRPSSVLMRSSFSAVTHVHDNIPVKCSASEALVETFHSHSIDKIFGIVGSAFIDPLDLFPAAGIEFIDVQHEQNAVHMADVYGRLKGRPGVAMGQNGPGISNMVTGVATAFLNHSPVCVITPQSGSDSMGKLGFQEMEQLPIFSKITKYQVHVENSARIAELTSRALNNAINLQGPTQLNYSRNLLGEVHNFVIPKPQKNNSVVPTANVIQEITDRIMQAQNPVLLAGGGLRDASEVQRLSKFLDCPVATTYLHNDSFPISDPRALGSLGYMGSKAAMRATQDSDLVVAIGSRLNPFGVTPQYGIPYWDHSKALIQIDINSSALGVSCNPSIAVHGDAVETIRAVNENIEKSDLNPRHNPNNPYKKYLEEWHRERSANDLRVAEDGRIPPKLVLRTFAEVIKGLDGPIVTTDIGHCCSQALAYLEFDRPQSLFTAGTFGSCATSIPMAVGARFADADRPVFALCGDGAVNMQGINELLTCSRYGLGITIVVFRNEVWGAELLNQLIWTDARAVGTEIKNPPISGIAAAFGVHGVRVSHSLENLKNELEIAADRQSRGETTLIEVMCTPAMGAPFRSDAMSCPTRYLEKYQHLSVKDADYQRQYVPTRSHT